MFEEISHDVFFLSEAILFILDLVSAALLLALVYLAYLGHALIRPDLIGLRGTRGGRLAAFIIACILSLAISHGVLYTNGLLLTIGTLFIGIFLSLFVYLIGIRRIVRSDDMRVPYTTAVLGSIAFSTFGALLMLWVVRERVELEGSLAFNIDTLAKVATVAVSAIVAVFAYIMKSDQANRTAKQRIYQTLELQSIELFRFEAANAELASKVWHSNQAPSDQAERYQVKQYVCQMLNLFEMACRFRIEGILPPAVFGSWVIWIWELCGAQVFRDLWADKTDDLPINYVPNFRDVIEGAIKISKQIPDQGSARIEFFRWLGDYFDCDEIAKWLDPKSNNQRPLLLREGYPLPLL
jgi:hypothetical protein